MPVTFSGAVLSGSSLFSVTEGFSPYSLFASGEQGAWYDPSDYSTMFQDSAGNTRVTTVEQPVGRILDKSGRGNHATQSTSASRPVLSARVNLLTKTEQFDDAAWTKTSLTVSANAATAPDGTSTADTVTVNNAAGVKYLRQNSVLGAATYSFSVALKYVSQQYVSLTLYDAAYKGCVFDIQNGSVTFSQSATGSVVNLGNGWYRCTIVVTVAAGTVYYDLNLTNSGTALAPSYTGNSTDNFFLWGADLRVTNDGVGLPAYQRVNTSTDYDTVGFPMYLRFDGTDDSLATGSINFTSTDKMTVWAGVRKLSDAASGMITELSVSSAMNTQTLNLIASSGNLANYAARAYGSADNTGTISTFTAPITNVLSASLTTNAANATAAISMRANGAAQTLTPGNSNVSIGNFGSYPLYIGSRGGSSLRFNGRLYSLIVRGASSTAGQISDTEGWVNGKTRAY